MAVAFLILNMCVTMLLVVISAFEVVMKRSVLLSGTLKTAAQMQGPPSLQQTTRQTFSIALPSLSRLSLTPRTSSKSSAGARGSAADIELQVKDVIPRPSEAAIGAGSVAGSNFEGTVNPINAFSSHILRQPGAVPRGMAV